MLEVCVYLFVLPKASSVLSNSLQVLLGVRLFKFSFHVFPELGCTFRPLPPLDQVVSYFLWLEIAFDIEVSGQLMLILGQL